MNREDQTPEVAQRPQRETVVERDRTSPRQYLREVRGELKKVAWPNLEEVRNYTIVVLVVTIVLTALTWALDWVVSNAVINLFSR